MLNEWERFNTNRVNAASGSADAQYYMGTCYLNGRNVARDPARAEKWFALSASSGYVEAIRMLKTRFLYTDERIEKLRLSRKTQPAAGGAETTRPVVTPAVSVASEQKPAVTPTAAPSQGRAEPIGLNDTAILRRAAELGNNAKEQEAIDLLNPLIQAGDARAVAMGERMLQRLHAPTEPTQTGHAPTGTNGYTTVRQLRERASEGDVRAQLQLAELYYYGRGVERDHKMAVQWYRNAAEGGLSDAACQLGNCYVLGSGVEVDYESAYRWFAGAAESGNPVALYNLGVCYRNGWGVTPDRTREVAYYRQAADLGNGQAQYAVGRACLYGYGCKQDLEAAHFWLARACNQNVLGAIVMLASLYENGFGVKRDRTFAFSLLQKVVRAGGSQADGMLAKYYYYGEIVECDREKAVRLALNAIARGDTDTDNSMLLYRYYVSVGNGEEAFRWVSTAASNGIADAYYEKGLCYELGRGVAVNGVQAFYNYLEAARREVVAAYKKLAECYRTGYGTGKDVKEAARYAKLYKQKSRGI